MRLILIAFSVFFSAAAPAQVHDLAVLEGSMRLGSNSVETSPIITVAPSFSVLDFGALRQRGVATERVMGYSKSGRPISFYYFPGRSQANALVIGGVHGSELSAIEVARELIRQLKEGEKPDYSVVIIPTLFPDNAASADHCECDRHQTNRGRYSAEGAVDPNRQLPALGKPFTPDNPVDAYGRPIEKENKFLLQVLQALAPSRVINLHAIKEAARAGIYADPRTDCEGKALGFTSDQRLALMMANYVAERGGTVPGNKLRTSPTALYYLDPAPAPAGALQARNLIGTTSSGKINGVSLGGWASTAVCDTTTGYSRPAMRLLTLEFPGYKKPEEYETLAEKNWFARQVLLYAGAIYQHFLSADVPDGEPEGSGEWAAK